MAFTVTATGGLCLMAGVLLLGQIVGSYDLDVVLAAGERIRADALYPAALVLIALGALTKSAAVSLPLLAAPRDGGAHAGVVLPAFGDDGEGRRVPAGAAVAGAGRHAGVDLDHRRAPGCAPC